MEKDKILCIECDFEEVDEYGDTCDTCLEHYEDEDLEDEE